MCPIIAERLHNGGVTAFMGNRIFAAAVMSMAISVSLMTAAIIIRNWTWTQHPPEVNARQWPKSLALAAVVSIIMAVQLLGIAFTLNRGSWVGTFAAIVVMLALTFHFLGWRAFGRATLIIGLASGLALVITVWGRGGFLPPTWPWIGGGVVLIALFSSVVIFGKWRTPKKLLQPLTLVIIVSLAVLIVPILLSTGIL
jgi:hypothetical protein